MRSRNWCFTLNNPQEDEIPKDWEHTYIIYQLEQGENGTEHFQGYIRFKNPRSLSSCKRINSRAHWEVRKGTHKQARDYCLKSDTKIGETIQDGEEPEQGKRSDLEAIRLDIESGAQDLEIADNYFGQWCRYGKAFRQYRIMKMPRKTWKPQVTVIYGATGTGKTRLAAERYPDAYWKENSRWWDGYDNHDTVIIDEFYGWLPYAQLLRILDRYPMTVEVKGGAVNFVPKRIIITSNQRPDRWYSYEYPQLERRIDTILEMTTLCTIIKKGDLNNL